jgi:hypothetical protein
MHWLHGEGPTNRHTSGLHLRTYLYIPIASSIDIERARYHRFECWTAKLRRRQREADLESRAFLKNQKIILGEDRGFAHVPRAALAQACARF